MDWDHIYIVDMDKPPAKQKRKGKLDGILDSLQLIKMIEVQGRTYSDIADQYGVTKQAIHLKYQSIKSLLDPNKIETYEKQKPFVLSAIEAELLNDLLDHDKRSKASLNNTAYAFDKIHTANRLERGKSTSNLNNLNVSLELSEQAYDDLMRDRYDKPAPKAEEDVIDV